MKAVLVEAPGQPVVLCDDVEIEGPRAGQVRVKVAHCGLCHSDLSIVDGVFPSAMPVVVGHEAAGVVDVLGPGVEGLAPGDPVLLTPCPPCGSCYWCVRGEASLSTWIYRIATNVSHDHFRRRVTQQAKVALSLEDTASEEWIAGRLGVSPAYVHGTVTFYTMFKQRPSGKYHIQVCTTLSCMLRESDNLMAHLEKKLGIKAGEVTSDGKFSLIGVECLGSCGSAPMFQLNDEYHENLTHDTVDAILSDLP